MQENQITCPHCHKTFSLADIKNHELENLLEERSKKLEDDFNRKKVLFAKEKAEEFNKILEEKIKEQEENQKRKDIELESLRKRDEESRKKELQFLREKNELEQKQKNLEFEKEKAILEERKKMEEEFSKKSDEKVNLEFEKKQLEYDKKMQEKEKQMDMLRRALDEATRKASQWSMQIQGESQEDVLKALLEQNFPIDTIRDVEKWIKWADIIQEVKNKYGVSAWIIAWESKNTKAWNDEWVVKIKEDRLLVNAAIAIIVSNVLPEDIKTFWKYKDIWVASPSHAVPLAFALRENLISLMQIKESFAGKDEKMEMMYNYLSSPEFKSKIENIVEAFTSMKEDLDAEKRSFEKQWAKREKQLERVITNTSRLYWDMQGLMGPKLQKINYFELPSWEDE